MQFQGELSFPQSPDAVFKLLSDARFLVSALPDASNVKLVSEDEAHCTVRPQFTFTAGTIDVTLRVVDRQAPNGILFQLDNKSVGGGAEVQCALQLRPADQGTAVLWQAMITRLSGLLRMVPSGLIRGAAQQSIQKVWAHVAQRVQQEAGSQPT